MPYGFTYEFNFEIPEYIPPTEKEMKNSKLVLRATGLPGFRLPQRGPFFSPPLILNRMLEIYDNGRFVGGTATVHEIDFANFGATKIYSADKLRRVVTNFINRRKHGINPDGTIYTKITKTLTGGYPNFDISVLKDLRYPIAFATLDGFPPFDTMVKRRQPIMNVKGTISGFLIIRKNAFYEGTCIIRKYTPDLKDFHVYPVVTRMDDRYSIGVYDDYVLPVKDLLFSLPIYIYTTADTIRLKDKKAEYKGDFTQDIIDAHNAALPRR